MTQRSNRSKANIGHNRADNQAFYYTQTAPKMTDTLTSINDLHQHQQVRQQGVKRKKQTPNAMVMRPVGGVVKKSKKKADLTRNATTIWQDSKSPVRDVNSTFERSKHFSHLHPLNETKTQNSQRTLVHDDQHEGKKLAKRYSSKLYNYLHADDQVRKRNKQASELNRQHERLEKEMSQCTFTPNIGRKGVVFATINRQSTSRSVNRKDQLEVTELYGRKSELSNKMESGTTTQNGTLSKSSTMAILD